MIEWYDTGTWNEYAGDFNKQASYKGVQLLVFRRMYGWSFTCRLELTNGNWLQESAGSNNYNYFMEEAMKDSIFAAEDLLAGLGDRVVVRPAPVRKDKIPTEVLENLGIGNENH